MRGKQATNASCEEARRLGGGVRVSGAWAGRAGCGRRMHVQGTVSGREAHDQHVSPPASRTPSLSCTAAIFSKTTRTWRAPSRHLPHCCPPVTRGTRCCTAASRPPAPCGRGGTGPAGRSRRGGGGGGTQRSGVGGGGARGGARHVCRQWRRRRACSCRQAAGSRGAPPPPPPPPLPCL